MRNQHLSYSRTQLWEQCKLAWKRRYVDRAAGVDSWNLAWGRAQHEVMEAMYQHHVEEELDGRFDLDLAMEEWKLAWRRNMDGMGHPELFDRGWQMVYRALKGADRVSHWDILGVELRFLIPAGRFKILGYIDRVDRVGDSIEVIDYKSNYHLFAPWDVDDNLQMTIYDEAVRQRFPWAEDVKLTFHMLQHDVMLHTSRTPEQRESAMKYMETVGEAMESELEFEPRLNMYCWSCQFRGACPAWRDVLLMGEEMASPESLLEIAEERERMVILEKTAKGRLRDLDRQLMDALRDEDELKLNGRTYKVYEIPSLSYPTRKTVELLSKARETDFFEMLSRITSIDNKLLGKELDKLPERDRMILKARLENISTKRYYPRVWSTDK
jgi:RecB family exonuclease